MTAKQQYSFLGDGIKPGSCLALFYTSYQLDYLKVNNVNGTKKVRSSYQRLEHEVIYRHNMPKIIKDKQKKKFVYVMPKFVLGDNEKLLIELKELDGHRILAMKTKL